MPIETRIRKKRRLTIIQPICTDVRDIVVGCGFDNDTKKGMLVIGELETLIHKDTKQIPMNLQQLQEHGNSVVMFIRDPSTCDMMIQKLQCIKRMIVNNQKPTLAEAITMGIILAA